jgi:hypothetical protein
MLTSKLPFRPEVAAVLDERSMLGVAAGGMTVTRPGIYEVRAPLGRMGAPYGQYLLDDVAAGRVSAKLYVFLNAWNLSAAERARLLRATRGATRVWCYAPGYYEEDRVAPGAMRALTGFTLKRVTPAKARAIPTEAGKRLGLQQPFGIEKSVQPLFAVTDAMAEEILAVYPDGSASVVLRQTTDGSAIFVGAPGMTSEILRVAARVAGVHLFTETDCNVYANGPYLALHAAQDGPVKIHVRQVGQVMDLLTGQPIGAGPEVSLPLKRGESRVLWVK